MDKVGEMLSANPELGFVDLEEIEIRLISEKYEKQWQEKGYITIDENGSW